MSYENRVKILEIPAQTAIDMLTHSIGDLRAWDDTKGSNIIPILEGLPSDYTITSGTFDWSSNTFQLRVYSDTYPVVAVTDKLPVLTMEALSTPVAGVMTLHKVKVF